MKKLFLLFLTVSLLTGYLVYAKWNSPLDYEPLVYAYSDNAGSKAPDAYIVKVKEGANPQLVVNKHGLTARFVYKNVVKGFAGTIPPGLLKKITDDPDVVSVSPDRVVVAEPKPDNPGKPGGGGGGSAEQVIPSGVTRIGAVPGDLSFTGAGVGVAIVDTGIDLSHADLTVSPECFYAYSASCQDDNGHGTHVAGIVSALDNEQDTVGVAPNAMLYAVKVLDNTGSGYDSDVIAGLDWIYANTTTFDPPIRVVNLSLGRPGTLDDNPTYREAFQNLMNAGISVVVSAGNNPNIEVAEHIPSAYPEVMAIASTSAEDGSSARKGKCAGIVIPKDTASYFTTDGAGVVISAPGESRENVKNSCTISSEGILSLQLGGGTTRKSGTSMSAPHATGVVALMYEKAGSLTLIPADAKNALGQGADLPGIAPLDSPTISYTFDGVREGVLSAPGALNVLP